MAKYYWILFISVCLFFIACRQKSQESTISSAKDSLTANPYSSLDQSPMDMSYFPVDFPVQKMNGHNKANPLARIIYSRPHKKGRTIFGKNVNSLCRYGIPWRLGANEATEITFYNNVSIRGTNISKGSYVIYCIPYQDRWTIVLNNNLYTWGLHIDSTHDVFKTDIPLSAQSPPVEDFTIIFSATTYGADLIMVWDNVKAALPIDFSK